MPKPAPSGPPPVPASRGGTVLLPATKFFVRRIPLVAGQDAAAQAELALETIGPFAPGQLFHGHCPSADGTQALVFAAYRKNFTADDTARWNDADAVLPGFVVLARQAAPASPEVWLHESGGSVAAILWDGAGPVPAGVLAREIGERAAGAVGDELANEARQRLGAPTASVKNFQGDPVAAPLEKEGLALTLRDRKAAFTPAELRAMDVRDKADLAAQTGRRTRDRRLWFAFAAAAALLAACVVGEVGLQISRAVLGSQRAKLQAGDDAVQRLRQASDVVTRLEQLAGQSLRPFEMIALINAARPATLEFLRASTSSTNPRQLEIEAQTGNAADPQAYEQALGRVAEVEKVELRDLRTSGGRTTFLVAVTFKPGFAGPGGAR